MKRNYKIFILLLSFFLFHQCANFKSKRNQFKPSGSTEETRRNSILMDSFLFFKNHSNHSNWSEMNYAKMNEFIVKEKSIEKLPENIRLCKNLKYVDLSFCSKLNIDESISLLENLDKIESLDLAYCGLESFPKPILRLKKIKSLSLSGNCISELSNEIRKLENLEELNLNFNLFLDFKQLCTSLKDSPSLDLLSIKGCGLETVDNCIRKLSFLKGLDLSQNKLRRLPCELTTFKDLKVLSLQGMSLDSLILPQCFKSIDKLGSTPISFYNIEGEKIKERPDVGYVFPYEYIIPDCQNN